MIIQRGRPLAYVAPITLVNSNCQDPDSISQTFLEQIVLFVYFLTFNIPMRICHELIKEQYKVTYLSPLQVNNAHEQIDRQEAHLFGPVFPGQVHF